MVAHGVSPVHRHDSRLAVQPVATTTDVSDFKCAAMFREIEKQFEKDGASYVKKVNGIIGFKIKGPGGKEALWIVDAKNGNGSLELESGKKPDCTISMKDDDIVELMLGNLNPNTAFFSGKLKISGNMGIAMKIQNIMPARPKL